jgi:hypothetical protein
MVFDLSIKNCTSNIQSYTLRGTRKPSSLNNGITSDCSFGLCSTCVFGMLLRRMIMRADLMEVHPSPMSRAPSAGKQMLELCEIAIFGYSSLD